MNTYEVLYMDDEMTVIAARKLEAANIMQAVRLITGMSWPPKAASVSITERLDNGDFDGKI